jgi:hypothetical protein
MKRWSHWFAAVVSRREPWGLAAFLALGQISFFHRMLWTRLRETVGDYVNQILCNFILEHPYLWMTRRPDHASFWDPPVYYPTRNVFAYAETLLGAGPFYWPWRFLGFPADTAHQLWIMTLPGLAFLAAYLLFRSGFHLAVLPSLVGSYVCAFGKTLAAQINNPQLHTLVYAYFGIYCLCRVVRSEERQPLWVLGFFASLVGQLYACFYVGWFYGFFLGLAGLMALAMPRLRPILLGALRRNLPAVVIGAMAAGLAMAPLVVHSLAVVRAMGWAGDASTPFLPRLESWLYPGRRAPLYFWLGRMPFFQGIPGEPEQRLFVGAVTLVCAGLGLWAWRGSSWVRLLALVTVALVVLTTELPDGFCLWHAVRAVVPGARALRIVPRVGVLLAFPAGVGLAAFFSRPRRAATVVFLLGLCIADQAYSEYTFSKIETRRIVAAYAAAVPPGCRGAYLVVRTAPGIDRPHWVLQEEIQLSELARGVPLVNGGYTRFYPPGYGTLGRNVFSKPEDLIPLRRDFAAWLTLHGLSRQDVCWIEVPDPHQAHR